MVERILEQKIIKEYIQGKAILLLGARQVGKTTLLRRLISGNEKIMFLNGDEPDVRQSLNNVTSTQIRALIGNVKTLVIDEAQLIPDIGITLKLIIDYIKEVRLFVSGSSSIDLANKINEPLTGRKLTYQIFPLSFQEMVNHHGLLIEKRNLPVRMIFGYYPEIVNSPGNEVLLLKDLVGSYLYKDILSYGHIQKPVILDKLLKAIALQIGSEVSYHELAQTVGADKETVERYIDLLEKAFIIFRLNAFSRNVRNEIKKSKKIYFWDNGVRNAMVGSYSPFESRADKGALWENFIISERIKYLSYNNFYGYYYFWRTKQQQEIDFIEEVDGGFSAWEFKLSESKKAKIPLTFSRAYALTESKVIHPGNIEEFVL